MMKKWGKGGLFIVIAATLYIISLFMPWVNVVLFSQNGFQQEGYLVFILFIYPLYMVLANKSMNLLVGLALAIFTVLFLVYYATSPSAEYMGATIGVAGAGLYVAILAGILFLAGIIIKSREERSQSKEKSSE